MTVLTTPTRISGRLMGTEVEILVLGDPIAASVALDVVAENEQRWSRFMPASDLSRLNRTGSLIADEPTARLVELALDAWSLTDGGFDPTVEVARLGYDRTLSDVRRVGRTRPQPAPGPSEVIVDWLTADCARIHLPSGVKLDLGGIAKGYSADLAAKAAVDAGATGVLVNIGGDIRTMGCSPDSLGWAVEIVDPAAKGTVLATVRINEGAIATSTTRRRRWATQDGERHHLVDPRTGDSVAGGPSLVSVIAGAGWWAEAQTKAILMSRRIDRPSPALVAGADGVVRLENGFEEFAQ